MYQFSLSNETAKIIEIGRVNGYHESTIRSIINKHQEKKLPTFYDLPAERDKRSGVRFFPDVTKVLKPAYKKHGMELVHRSDGSLKQLLGTVKDKPLDLHRSGIYRIQCFTCGRYYYGMSIRKIYERFNEHVNSAKWKRKTAIGKHICSFKHDVHISDLKLVQPISQTWKIEYYEAIHIHKHKHESLLNIDEGNVVSPLLKLFTVPRVIDKNVIELIDDTPDTSTDEFYDCEEI